MYFQAGLPEGMAGDERLSQHRYVARVFDVHEQLVKVVQVFHYLIMVIIMGGLCFHT